MKATRAFKSILAALGVVLFVILIWRAGPLRLIANMHRLGFGLLAVIGTGGLAHAVKAWAWRFTFDRDARHVPFWKLFGVRLAGEAVSQLSFAGPMAGETTRALVLKSGIPLIEGAASVVVDRGMFIFTSLIVILSGICLSLVSLKVSAGVALYEALVAFLLFGLLFLFRLALTRHWPLLSAALSRLGRLRPLEAFAFKRKENVAELERAIWSFHDRSGMDFWRAMGLNLLGHLLSILEVWLVLWLLSLHPSFVLAFLVEILIKLLNVSGALVPGNIGIYEGGIMLILRSQGLSADVGLTLAIARRIRALFWTGIGLLLLLFFLRTGTASESSVGARALSGLEGEEGV